MRRTIVVFFMALFCFGLITIGYCTAKAQETPLPPVWEQVGHKALQWVHWNWEPILGEWDIRFGPERIGYHGLTDFSIYCITIWIRPVDSPEAVAGMIVHELAHAFDRKYLTPALRAQWLAARGFPPDMPWYFPVGRLGSDYLSGAGDFAESVKWTLQGPRTGFSSCLGLHLNEQRKKLIARGCQGRLPDAAQQVLIKQWLMELPRTVRTGEK
jgi:hypothetical protein